MYTNVKVSKVHFEMLQAAAKKMHIKPEALLEELIQVKYHQK
jgi:hypothetical protein|tara:strand:- start:768 stop:893 length:126 start_codon:yes stop_codon:yes gene_type:complete